MTNEQKLIKLLLDHTFWQQNRHRLAKAMFPGDLAGIYDAIKAGHDKYERSLTLDEVKALHRIMNPTMTVAARNNVAELFYDINEEVPLGPDVAADVLRHMWKVETGRRIAEHGVNLMDGKENSLGPLARIIEQTQDDFLPREEVAPITRDIDTLLKQESERSRWKFNLSGLNKVIPGIAPGDFTVIFARPETGKTAAHVSLACAPGGWTHQGAAVHVLVNEEPGARTMLRAISACSGITKDDLIANPHRAKPSWAAISERYRLIDDIEMTMDALDAYAKRHRPDILVIDQLDKVKVDGTFARDDQRLRETYLRAREIAKRHNCAVIGVGQASADGEGKLKLHYSAMEGSKTGKAAEADLIIGIGMRAVDENSNTEDRTRYWHCSKNKLSGFHGTVPCMLDSNLSRYVD